MNDADPGHRWGLGILRRPVNGGYRAGVAGRNWSKAPICAERRAWAVVTPWFMDRAVWRERRGLLFSSTQRVD